MTAAIQQETNITVTTQKGKKIRVVFFPFGHVGVYIFRNGFPAGSPGGKHFRSMSDAIANYKLVDIKTALESLNA